MLLPPAAALTTIAPDVASAVVAVADVVPSAVAVAVGVASAAANFHVGCVFLCILYIVTHYANLQ